jgi:hypothetical protein
MELSAALCRYAETQNNLLYIAGGGIDTAAVPAGQPGPWPVSLAIGMIVGVPWMATNQEHTVHIALIDADGNPVEVQKGPDEREQFNAEFRYNVGRPPHIQSGDSQQIALALNVPVLPFPKLGRYDFVISVDGTEMRRLPYRVVGQTGMTIAPGGLTGLIS